MMLSSRASPRWLLFTCILASVTTGASAGSRYANDDPDSCEIVGDSNIYGLGVRLGYYLQWFAAILTSYIAPDQLGKTFLAFDAFVLASFAAVYQNAAQGYFIAVEWHIVVMLTMCLGWSTYYFNPGACVVQDLDYSTRYIFGGGPRVKRTFYGQWGFLQLLFAIDLFTVSWMYWRGNYIGHKQDCPVDFFVSVFVYSFWVNIYDARWIVVIKVIGVFAALLGLVLTYCGLVLLLSHGTLRVVQEKTEAHHSRITICTYAFMQLFCGGWIIAMVEMTIRDNGVDLSEAPLTSSGQLIPLLVGAMTLATVVLSWLRSLVRSSGPIPIFTNYMSSVSSGADKIERLFRKLRCQQRETLVEMGELNATNLVTDGA